jgi:flagellar basal-body rod protein FlgB
MGKFCRVATAQRGGWTATMSISNIPLVSQLRERMHWHQSRQKVLAENVANANTPGFQPKDLVPARSNGAGTASSVAVAQTNPGHITAQSSLPTGTLSPARRYETSPSGNAVHLEDEMMKVAENHSEYQLAASLYQKSLGLLRIAAGVRGG